MKKLLILFSILGSAFGSHAQKLSNAEIRNIDFSLVKDSLVITYDIANAEKDMMYFVTINVFTADNVKVDARSFSGDVNRIMPGGKNKRAVWHLNRDGIVLDHDIFVEVQAIARKEIKNTEIPSSSGSVSPIKCALFSLALPGLGQFVLKKQISYFGIGLLCYGMAAFSIFDNQAASTNYDKYLIETDYDMREEYYGMAWTHYGRYQIISKCAIGLWAGDVIWTYFQAKRHNKQLNGTTLGPKLLISPGIGYTGQPVLCFKYRF
ncbi:MAG: hypothetical protein V2A54_16840 [Bacteroidota bacterium]